MSRSLIYVVNQDNQNVIDGGRVNLGNIIRRFGCNLNLSNNSIMASGIGYYNIDGTIVVTPTAAGTITATLYRNGVAIPGATASQTVAVADTTVTLPLVGAIRESCACQDSAVITLVLTGVDSLVSNVSLRVTKD